MKKKKTKNEWICDRERMLVQSPVMDILEKECHSSEDGRKHTFFALRSRDWCNIIPVTTDGKIVFVRQFRVGAECHTLELPGGVMDPHEKNAEATALRELTEETGYSPLPGAQVRHVMTVLPNPAILNNHNHSYIVGPVVRTQEQKLDHGEMIEVVEIPIEEVPAKIRDGEINHVIMQNALLSLVLASTEGQRSLTEQLRSFVRV